MRHSAETIFYSLSALALGAALFVLQPTHNTDLSRFQFDAKHEFATAALQVFGDDPGAYGYNQASFIVSSINQFYAEAANATIELIQPLPGQYDDLTYIARNMKNEFVSLYGQIRGMTPQVAGVSTSSEQLFVPPADFMSQPPLANIVPDTFSSAPKPAPIVESAQITLPQASTPVPKPQDIWVNLQDGATGQVYCVAIFNAEVNRYLGPCRNDYH